MCTVSWLRTEKSYSLLCNRDEKKTRAAATSPRYLFDDGVGILAPTDPQGGGTWIAVNSHGTAIALLNGIGRKPETARSRGQLPDRLIRLGGLSNILVALEQLDLTYYLPFRLVMVAPDHPVHIFTWDGLDRRFEIEQVDCGFVTSSSSHPREAAESRRALFDSLHADSAESLATFHREHGGAASAVSPCMHREDAETVSFTRISVDRFRASLFYASGAPCRNGPGFQLEIPRA